VASALYNHGVSLSRMDILPAPSMDHHLTTDALSTVSSCSPRRASGRNTPSTGLHVAMLRAVQLPSIRQISMCSLAHGCCTRSLRSAKSNTHIHVESER